MVERRRTSAPLRVPALLAEGLAAISASVHRQPRRIEKIASRKLQFRASSSSSSFRQRNPIAQRCRLTPPQQNQMRLRLSNPSNEIGSSSADHPLPAAPRLARPLQYDEEAALLQAANRGEVRLTGDRNSAAIVGKRRFPVPPPIDEVYRDLIGRDPDHFAENQLEGLVVHGRGDSDVADVHLPLAVEEGHRENAVVHHESASYSREKGGGFYIGRKRSGFRGDIGGNKLWRGD